MEKNGNLVLTGWGYAEYVASAAVALKALGGNADVYGMSRRRLPEFLGELAAERGTPRWKRIYLLGLSLSGDPEALREALAKLKAKGVEVTWISALEMPEHIADMLDGAMKVRYYDGSLLEAVGQTFGVDVEAFMPFTKPGGTHSRASAGRSGRPPPGHYGRGPAFKGKRPQTDCSIGHAVPGVLPEVAGRTSSIHSTGMVRSYSWLR